MVISLIFLKQTVEIERINGKQQSLERLKAMVQNILGNITGEAFWLLFSLIIFLVP